MDVIVCFRSENDEQCSDLFIGENIKQGAGPEQNYCVYCHQNCIEKTELIEFIDREQPVIKIFMPDAEGDEKKSITCSLQKKYVACYTDGLGIQFLFPAQFPILSDSERRQRFYKIIMECDRNKISVDKMMDRVRRTDVFGVLWSSASDCRDALCRALIYSDLHLFVYSIVKDFLYTEVCENNVRSLLEVIIEEVQAQEYSFFPDLGSESPTANIDEDACVDDEVTLCHEILQRARAKISTDVDRATIFELCKKRENGLKKGVRLGNKLLHTVASFLLPNEFLMNDLAIDIRKKLEDFRYARKDECKFMFDIGNKKQEFISVVEFASRFKNIRQVEATMYVVRYNGEEKSLTSFLAKWKKIVKKAKLSIVDISNMLGRISCITEILSVQYTTRDGVIGRFVPKIQVLLEHYTNLENSIIVNYHRTRHDVFEELYYELKNDIQEASPSIQKFNVCNILPSILRLLHEPGTSSSLKKEFRVMPV
ncbi:hypothetical protein R5R35_009249 [Gryllus longicercus]|uniref:Uncharacterized protein n=1 Tax=Gryllus longicercus TaxID=2509291 RepID=A0AAN9Z112_9ORTH